jgi:serine/threonine protein kinase/WD40 repeat protein
MTGSEPKLRELFNKALEARTAEDQAAILDQACQGDAELRAQVEELLKAHREAGSFLQERSVSQDVQVDAPSALEPPCMVIGPYKLLELIGEGGMGTVWMAEQTDPVRRLVAVKLVKAGMDSRQVVARFEAERQALALMDHSNIARVLDAGAIADGRPYFIMDLIKGVPITRYCDEHLLTPRQRLELFVPVCQAVQHAHQKGIIHRDLKPSNVLVALYDDKPVPKVIDFGVAKAVGQALTEETLVTGFGALVGTLEYMSPEQAKINQLDIDTRSDIYSLGVLLYELLAGSPPFSRRDLEKVGMLEMLRVIRELEPSKPSTKLSTAEGLPTLAANRGTEPAKLARLMRGELDWIVMKALEKDRNRRYETANSFAMDVQRYLADAAVLACPPSVGYRLRKFVRRNQGSVLAAALLLIALVGGVIGTTWGMLRATEAEADAVAQAWQKEQERNRAVEASERATRAEREARHRLFQAKLAEGKAGRRSRRTGQRLDSWKALAEAALLARELGLDAEQRMEVRNEAIACLALMDLRLVNEYEAFPGELMSAFTPDLTCYARSDREGNISIRRVDDDGELAELPMDGPDAPKTAGHFMCFSANGKLLAVRHHESPGKAGNIRMWDWRHGKLLWQSSESFPWASLDFSSDCRHLAMGHSDGTLRIHDAVTGTERLKPTSLGMTPTGLAYNPDGTKLAVINHGSGEVQIRDAATGSLLRNWSTPGGLWSLAWHPRSALLATGHNDLCVHLWDTSSGQQRGLLRGHQSAVVGLSFTPGGNLLLSSGWDGSCRIWDVWSQQELLRLPASSGQFSQDGRQLAARAGRHLALWEVVADGERRTLPRSPGATRDQYHGGSISPDGRWLGIGSNQGAALWNFPRGEAVAFAPVGRVHDVQFHTSGKELLVTGRSGLFASPMRTEPGRLLIHYQHKPLVAGYCSRMNLDWSGRLLAVGTGNGAYILDPTKRPPVLRVLSHPGAPYAVVSSDGKWIASATHNGLGVKVWEARTGEGILHLHPNIVGAKALFSPDCQQLVTSTSAKYSLWSVGSWEPCWEILRKPGSEVPGAAAFTQDGSTLAVMPSHSEVALYDYGTRQLLARLDVAETNMINLLLFSRDGTLLVTISEEGDAWIWDLRRVRARLREIDLDWDQPPYPAGEPLPEPPTVELYLGESGGTDGKK